MIKTRTLFITYPRSGHHALMDALKNYFGDEFRYCEFYTGCHSVPCQCESNAQKNHDLLLNLVLPPDWDVIIQFRNALAANASWYRSHHLRYEIPQTKENFIQYMQEKLDFYVLWARKWLVWNNHPKVSYNMLMDDRCECMRRIIQRMTGEMPDEQKLAVSASSLARKTELAQMPFYEPQLYAELSLEYFRKIEGIFADANKLEAPCPTAPA